MVLLRKVSKKEPDEKEIEEYLEKGGLVAADIVKKEKWMRMLLRIRSDAIIDIDKLISNRMGITRTSWILEAIQEKIKRESKKRDNLN